MEDKKKQLLSPTLFIWGAICIFDPNISILELLPDALGYLLWLLALTELEYVVPYFAEAREKLRNAAILSLTKLPVMLVMLFILGASPADRPMITVFSLAYAVLELVFVLPAVRHLFEGFSYLDVRFGTADADRSRALRGISNLSTAFILVKILFSTLPEFLLLGGDLSNVGPAFDPAGYFGFFAILFALFTLIVGIVWLSKFIPYIRLLCRSATLTEELEARRRTLLPSIAAQRERRHVFWLLFLLSAAALLSCDIQLDNFNFLPDFLMGIPLILFSVLAVRFGVAEAHRARPTLLFACLFTGTEAVSFGFSVVFAEQFDFTAVGHKILATDLYYMWLYSSIASAALLVLTLLSMLPLLSALVDNKTGHVDVHGRLHPLMEAPAIKRIGNLMLASGMLTAVFSPIYLSLRPRMESMSAGGSTGGTVTLQQFGGLWLLALLLSLVFFAMSVWYFSRVRPAVHAKYTV